MPASAGLEVTAAVAEEFQELKLTKNRAWLVAKLTEDETQIVLDEDLKTPLIDPHSINGEENKKLFEELKEKLTEKNPRFIVFDFRFEKEDGTKVTKLAYIFWCSDDAPVKKKMVSASSSQSIKKSFAGLASEFQINDKGDLNYEEMKVEVAKKK